MREELAKPLRVDAEEIMEMVRGTSGFIGKHLTPGSDILREVENLYIASQVAAVDLTGDKDDETEHFITVMYAIVALFDVFIARHPELIEQQLIDQVLVKMNLNQELNRIQAGAS